MGMETLMRIIMLVALLFFVLPASAQYDETILMPPGGEKWFDVMAMPSDCTACTVPDNTGATSSSMAFTHAAHYACENRGHLFTPSGTYWVTRGIGRKGINIETIDCQDHAMKFAGAGANRTIFIHDTYDSAFLISTCYDYEGDGPGGQYYSDTSSCTEDGNTANHTSIEFYGFTLKDPDPEAHIGGDESHGIDVTKAFQHVWIHDIHCQDIGDECMEVKLRNADSSARITNNTSYGVPSTGSGAPAVIYRAGHFDISDNTFLNPAVDGCADGADPVTGRGGSGSPAGPPWCRTGKGIEVSPTGTGGEYHKLSSGRIENNEIVARVNGIIVALSAPTDEVSGIVVAGNTIRMEYNEFLCTGTTCFGIAVATGAQGGTINQVLIEGNDVEGGLWVASAPVAGNAPGTGQGVRNVVVAGNSFRVSKGVYVNPNGIYLRADDVTLRDNIVDGFTRTCLLAEPILHPVSDYQTHLDITGNSFKCHGEASYSPGFEPLASHTINATSASYLRYTGNRVVLPEYHTVATLGSKLCTEELHNHVRYVNDGDAGDPDVCQGSGLSSTWAQCRCVGGSQTTNKAGVTISTSTDIDFDIHETDQVEVWKKDSGNYTKLALGVDYDVTINTTPTADTIDWLATISDAVWWEGGYWEELSRVAPPTTGLEFTIDVPTLVSDNFVYQGIVGIGGRAIYANKPFISILSNIITWGGQIVYATTGADDLMIADNRTEGLDVPAALTAIQLNNVERARVERNLICGTAGHASSRAVKETGTTDNSVVRDNSSRDSGCTGAGNAFDVKTSAAANCNGAGTGAGSTCRENTQ